MHHGRQLNRPNMTSPLTLHISFKLLLDLHGFYLDSFQTTKRHSYDGYSIYITIFNSFLLGVYRVGMTDLRPYFTQIIGHNFVNVHRIPTKVGIEIRLNEPF